MNFDGMDWIYLAPGRDELHFIAFCNEILGSIKGSYIFD